MEWSYICSDNFLFKQNNFFSWKTSFRSLLWASSGLFKEKIITKLYQTEWETSITILYMFVVMCNLCNRTNIPCWTLKQWFGLTFWSNRSCQGFSILHPRVVLVQYCCICREKTERYKEKKALQLHTHVHAEHIGTRCVVYSLHKALDWVSEPIDEILVGYPHWSDPAGTSRTQPVEVCFMRSPRSSWPCLHTPPIEVRLIGCQGNLPSVWCGLYWRLWYRVELGNSNFFYWHFSI